MYFYILIIGLIVALLAVTFEIVKRLRLRTAQLVAVHNFQEEHNLSNRDLKIFKDTLGEAKTQIRHSEKAIKGINNIPSSIKSALLASQEIFKYLMDHPKDIVLYDQFLYRRLPAFSDALEKRLALEQTKFENIEIIKTKKELELILIELSESIIKDYTQYLKDELEETVIENVTAKQGEK